MDHDEFDELCARLNALEEAVSEHIADNHGGGRVEKLEQYVKDLDRRLTSHLNEGR